VQEAGQMIAMLSGRADTGEPLMARPAGTDD